MMRTLPNLFSISAGAPFLPNFVEALLSGQLLENYVENGDVQAALADTLIYVPTRRAARALRSAFVELSRNQSTLLPTIRPLGDVDEEGAFFQDNSAALLNLAPRIGDISRLTLLARLIRPWRESLPAHIRAMFGSEDVLVPTNTADAIWLAADLAKLMDEVETEAADWSKLGEIAPDMVAEWWQVTLDFLTIVTTHWPQILADRHVQNPAAWRNQALRAEATRLKDLKPNHPIIVAGSTGTIPAVADLLNVISRLPKGAVVLPGLDFSMDSQQWDALDQAANDASVFGHPQYSLKKLLLRLGATREMVREIGTISEKKQQRSAILSQSLRPAATTDNWAGISRTGFSETLADLSLIEAASEREEALSIAMALRAAIEPAQKTAALVTGDRNLARRVVAELARFGVEANDSGGVPLSETLPAALLRLVLECLFHPGDPVAFLSLLKHPLNSLGISRGTLRQMAEDFELFALRDGTGRVHLEKIDEFVEARILALTNSNQQNLDINTENIISAQQLVQYLLSAIAPLKPFLHKSGEIALADIALATVGVFENFGRNEDGSLANLYAGESGKAMAAFLRDMVADHSGLTFEISEWPNVFTALIASRSVSPPRGGHPRLFIWGALESRLQTVDTMVIGGLNEGSWPASTRNDPFLSRPMKMTLTLDPPERRTGLAAHDFQLAMGMDKVIMSRSLRSGDAPSVPSRWLQRLETVAGSAVSAQMRARGQIYVHWARELDQQKNIAFVPRPCPKPPLNVRPKRFSVTEIETLRRDPYAIYAKKILKLKPLPDLIHDPSVAERGTLYHEIVAGFSQMDIDPKSPNALTQMLEIARAEFDQMQLPLDVEAIWWPRFEILAPAFLEWERGLSPRQRLVEISASSCEIAKTGVTLSGRADRIDVLSGNFAEILDFKTGSTPSPKQAASLMAPQLALEAALLIRNAFDLGKGLTPAELCYIRLTGKGEVIEQRICQKAGKTAIELAEIAWQQLQHLVEFYQNPNQGYLSRAMPALSDYDGDYDHLARVAEWSAGSDQVEED